MSELIFTILFLLLKLLIILIVSILISFIYYYIYFRFYKKMKFPKSLSKYKKRSIFQRIFKDFPRQFWLDSFNKIPGEFKEYGLHLVCGEQGSGKTTCVVELMLDNWQKKYPFLKVYTNMFYKNQNGEINHWKDLMDEKRNNGVFGVVNVIDEISSWFSSLQSKDFPPEMLGEISQQRKQRKCIIGTAQIFGRVAKPIREQTSYVYLPFTIAGCLTIVRVSKPIYYDEETFTFKKYIRTYFFVHRPEIRDSFDTYLKVKKMAQIGFKSDLERQTTNKTNNDLKVKIEQNKKK